MSILVHLLLFIFFTNKTKKKTSKYTFIYLENILRFKLYERKVQ